MKRLLVSFALALLLLAVFLPAYANSAHKALAYQIALLPETEPSGLVWLGSGMVVLAVFLRKVLRGSS